jgi:hypothetical protein
MRSLIKTLAPLLRTRTPLAPPCAVGVVMLVTAFLACGGATQSDLFTGGSGLSPDGGGGKDSGSVGADTGSGTDSGAGRDTGSPVDSGENDTGAFDAGFDSGVNDPGIYCNTSGMSGYCAVQKEVCCVTGVGTGGMLMYMCVPTVGAMDCAFTGGTPVACDDTADCSAGGKVCCGTRQGSGYSEVVCRTACDTAANQVRFCDPGIVPSDCPTPQACVPSTILIGYNVCQ